MNENLRTTLLAIIDSHLTASTTLAMIAADVETLRLMFVVMHPEADELLQKSLVANRDKYAEEIARKRAEFELMRVTVSKMVVH
jgi:hypothetical protein